MKKFAALVLALLILFSVTALAEFSWFAAGGYLLCLNEITVEKVADSAASTWMRAGFDRQLYTTAPSTMQSMYILAGKDEGYYVDAFIFNSDDGTQHMAFDNPEDVALLFSSLRNNDLVFFSFKANNALHCFMVDVEGFFSAYYSWLAN